MESSIKEINSRQLTSIGRKTTPATNPNGGKELEEVFVVDEAEHDAAGGLSSLSTHGLSTNQNLSSPGSGQLAFDSPNLSKQTIRETDNEGITALQKQFDVYKRTRNMLNNAKRRNSYQKKKAEEREKTNKIDSLIKKMDDLIREEQLEEEELTPQSSLTLPSIHEGHATTSGPTNLLSSGNINETGRSQREHVSSTTPPRAGEFELIIPDTRPHTNDTEHRISIDPISSPLHSSPSSSDSNQLSRMVDEHSSNQPATDLIQEPSLNHQHLDISPASKYAEFVYGLPWGRFLLLACGGLALGTSTGYIKLPEYCVEPIRKSWERCPHPKVFFSRWQRKDDGTNVGQAEHHGPYDTGRDSTTYGEIKNDAGESFFTTASGLSEKWAMNVPSLLKNPFNK